MAANRLRVLSIVVLLAVVAWPRPAAPCSSLVLSAQGRPVFGTNYDNLFAPGRLFVNKRGVRKSGWEVGTSGAAARWVSRYGSLVISCAGYQFAWGGMNEAGLVFSTMLLAGTRPPDADARPPLVGAYWWQYMLDTCATIEDVRKAAETVRIADTQDHYLACDRTGAVAVVECLHGRVVIRSGRDLPVPALTNRPYQVCLDHWTGRGPDPRDRYDSLGRFSRLARGVSAFVPESRAMAVDRAFELLEDVAASDTRWSFVCDTDALVFYLKSYLNPKLRFVDLKKIDFSCDRPTAMLDAHAGLAGDITGAFRDYSRGEVEAHMIEALAYFRPGVPPDTVRQVLAFFESFPCEPAKK
jgi:choloylglycine hydrolase